MFPESIHTVTRLLRQSILELCRASVPQDQGVEIDGIVCITIGDEENHLVVKLHDKLGNFRRVRDATSSVPTPRDIPGQSLLQSGTRQSHERENSEQAYADLTVQDGRKINRRFPNTPQATSVSSNLSLLRTPKNDLLLKSQRDLSDFADARDSILGDYTSQTSNTEKWLESNEGLRFTQPSSSSEIPENNRMNSISVKEEPRSDFDYQNDLSNAENTSPVSGGVYGSFVQDLVCEYCRQILPSFQALKEHNETYHGAYTCNYCWRSFLHYANYSLHLKTHVHCRRGDDMTHRGRDPASPYIPRSVALRTKRCGICSDIFKPMSSMMDHLRTAHDFQKCFSCVSCDEFFPSKATFVLHRRMVHSEVNQCRCENCEVYFTYVEFKHHEKECFASSDDPPRQSQFQKAAYLSRQSQDEAQIAILDRPSDPPASGDHPAPEADHASGDEFPSEESEKQYVDSSGPSSVVAPTSPAVDAAPDTQEQENQPSDIITEDNNDDHSNHSSSVETATSVCSVKIENNQKVTGVVDISGDSGASDESNSDETDSQSGVEPGLDRSPVGEQMEVDHSEDSNGNDKATEDMNLDRDKLLYNATLPASPPAGNSSFFIKRRIEEDSANACQGPFRCQNCLDIYMQFEQYERHCYEMHSRHVCPFCAQSFANKRNLQRHIRKHTGEMPYSCEECGQRFYRDDDLRRHKFKHQQLIKSFSCVYCNATVFAMSNLVKHLKDDHSFSADKVTAEEISKHCVI